ncbi:MAG: helix-turn-helix domain-containing protein [Paenibacillaceae bacterium]|nr:helix-turn-helix domain-containing protein [Paenibacillaceae bacterium]
MLRRLRKARRMTMKQLGAQLNLAESTISGYENNTRLPDVDKIVHIAALFGVSVDVLLGTMPGTAAPNAMVHAHDAAPHFPSSPSPMWLSSPTPPIALTLPDGRAMPLNEDEVIHLLDCLIAYRAHTNRLDAFFD